ncbi:MAG: DNA alkylation repair protein [Ignavibacteria bacterium CG08_land_8_20_14_0_20_37_9]|nr:MAG: DNA alkylation repair protein [Ignavibacteria bacterium CG08_land_8_20_14_0_20_37_9]PJC57332.1 MAG: DNA alkylation repair protein [Ignavibacteria bacterium CG_4_9_14_0_2_um_filter_37_13]
MSLAELQNVTKQKANKQQAEILQRFFKTGPGEYGEGDVFYGIKVPVQRTVAHQFQHLPLNDLQILLKSKVHEERLIALLILVLKFKYADEVVREKLFKFYLKNSERINNWDLVDLSADKIVGAFLIDKDKSLLFKLAKSSNLWERRIAMLSTYCFIKNGVFEVTLQIAELLLRDQQDLIHKAVGWMLREIGKRDLEPEEEFLKLHYKQMPRTMLRYAIEKFPEAKRQAYLKGTI